MYNSRDYSSRLRGILNDRLNGETIYDIAEKYGITKQCIYAMYKKLPKRERKVQTREVRDAGISRSIVIDVCYEYLLGTTEQALMEKYGLSKEQLYSCFYAVTDRVAGYRTVRGHKYELFDGLEKWRYANNMSLKGLAEVAGISPYFLMGMLRGWMHMPYNVASSLAGLSSMTLPELFHEMYTIDDNIRDNMYMKDAVKNIEAAIENGNSPQKEDIAYVCLAYADLQSDRKDAS